MIRPDAARRPGGDVVQAEKSAEALRRLGIRVTVSSGEGIATADVVHIFNLQTPDWTLGQVRAAKALGKRVVLSPIYWRDLRLPLGAVIQLGYVVLHLRSATFPGDSTSKPVTPLLPLGHRVTGRDILRQCNAILPNSEAEAAHLIAEFPELRGRRESISVVPNGVDVESFDRSRAASIPTDAPDLPDEFVLCVSRIDYRKNTLALIRATEHLGLPLVLVGAPVRSSAMHRAYEAACRAHGPHVRFLGHLPLERIWPLYARCAVHALPSFFETPGLSNLEAALAGARIVTTPHGCTREYLGGRAEYAEPTSVRSIARAVERARVHPPHPDLPAHVRERYSWDRVATATREVYERVLSRTDS